MLTIERGARDLAGSLTDQICRLYDTVFSAPPFVWSPNDSDDHRRMLMDLLADETFAILIAREGRELVGFAYGHRLPVAHGWWSGFPTPLPKQFTAEREGRTFTLTDFGVDRRYRGRGIGRQLHDTLLSSRMEERAVLSVQPTALDTKEIYVHLGWQHVGRKGPLEGVHPSYWDIYVHPLAVPLRTDAYVHLDADVPSSVYQRDRYRSPRT
jgi:ribosomal protein S18 acetylase RimI-like enzyme